MPSLGAFPASMSRRQRYTVSFAGGGAEVILAYTSQGAKQYYAQRGYAVASARLGDFRFEGGGWELAADVRAAAGLAWPVTIRRNGKPGGTRGTYRCRDGTHHIVVKSYLTAEQASATLWHELTHARQAERAGSQSAWEKVTAAQRRWPYAQRPIEIEARAATGPRLTKETQ